MAEYTNLNLCPGLSARIEGAVHALCEAWDNLFSIPDLPNQNTGTPPTLTDKQLIPLMTQPEPPNSSTNQQALSPAPTSPLLLGTQPANNQDNNPPEALDPETTPASQMTILLIDEWNGFNKLSCKAMLWTIRHQ
jgi:hypothetical protein